MRTLDEIERDAYAAGDTATLALIDACMDACGTRRSEAIERAVAMRQSVQNAADAEARIAELHAVIESQRVKLAAAERLYSAVRHVLTPYRTRSLGVPLKTPPKWAQFLIERMPA